MKKGDKLYLITRRDISPGYQAVQSCHAMRQFVNDHPEIDNVWFKQSNYIVLLSVESEKELAQLYVQALEKGIKSACFFEPDINDQMTAIALEPGIKSNNMCKKLQLALQ